MRVYAVHLVFLGAASLAATAGVDENDGTDDSIGTRQRVVRFSARLAPAKVLVVRCTRWVDGRTTLELEEIWRATAGTASTRITLTEVVPRYWRLVEGATEQHVQGVTLVRWEGSESGLEVERAPVAGGARHHICLSVDGEGGKPDGVEGVAWRPAGRGGRLGVAVSLDLASESPRPSKIAVSAR